MEGLGASEASAFLVPVDFLWTPVRPPISKGLDSALVAACPGDPIARRAIKRVTAKPNWNRWEETSRVVALAMIVVRWWCPVGVIHPWSRDNVTVVPGGDHPPVIAACPLTIYPIQTSSHGSLFFFFKYFIYYYKFLKFFGWK